MANIENGQREIVKRIETPRRDEEEIVEDKIEEKSVEFNEIVHLYEDEYNEHYNEEDKSYKKMLPILIGIATFGVVGYLGFNALNQANIAQSKIYDNNISQLNIKKEQSTSNEPTPYVEELAVKKDSDDIEKSVIALLSAQKIEAQKEKELEDRLKKEAEEKRLKAEKEKQKEKERKLAEEKQKEEIEEKIRQAEKRLAEEKQKEEIEEKIRQEEKRLAESRVKKEMLSKIEVVEKAHIVTVPKRRVIKYSPIKPVLYTVRNKDTLVDIGKRFYGGDPLGYKRIIRGNYKLRRTHGHIHAGQKIVIPRKDGKKRRRYIIIEKGDTLASISKEIYGTKDKILTIVRANRRIRSKRSTLRVGQKVYIPREKI